MIPFIAPALGFVGKNWKLFALLGAGLAFYLAWQHYQGLLEDNATLKANNTVLESAVETQRATTQEALAAIDEWQESQRAFQEKIEELNRFSVEANAEVRRLDELFAKHDLGALALAKPGLIERRINAGTRRIFRMLEAATTDTSRHDGS